MNKQEAIKTIEQDKIQVGRFTEITREVNAIQRKVEMVDYVPFETVVSVIDKINEQEKLYAVEIPNPNSAGGKLVLFKQQSSGRLILDILNHIINKPKYLHLTESEIKQDFDFLWQFAKEVE